MGAVGDSLNNMISGIERLSVIGGDSLVGVAKGIAAIGAALVAFAAGNVLAGLLNLVSKLLSFGQDSPIEQLGKIASYGAGIEQAAKGIDALGKAMSAFRSVSSDDMKAINDFPWKEATKFVAAGGAMTVKGVTVYNASKMNEDQKATLTGQAPAANNNVQTTVQTNNSTTTVVKPNIRNQESSQAAYMNSRYKPAGI